MAIPTLNKELDYLSYAQKQQEEKNINQSISLESLQTNTLPDDLNYLSYAYSPDREISFSREFAYGTAQEPTAIGSAYRITKAAFQSAFDRGETYEAARKRIENERQEKIFQEYPEFRNRPETAGVISGRAAIALADPVTFLVPWTKAAKAGKIVSLTTAGTFGASDLALREEALYGEIRPESVALGFGFGVVGGAVGDYGMALYNKGVKTKVKIPNKKGQMVDKDVDIPSASKAEVFKDEIPLINQTINKTLKTNAAQANKNLGFFTTKINNIEKQRNEITESIKTLEKQFYKKVNELNKIEDGFLDYSTYKTLLSTPVKKSEFIKQKEILLKQKKELNDKIKNIYLNEKPKNLLDVTSKTMINAHKEGVLTENLARGLIQETVRPLFGGIIGGGIGATFTEEGEGNEKTITWALIGAGLGQFQKMIQRSEYQLIPKKIRNAANEEFIAGAQRVFWNKLKGLTAGSHVQDLMSYSEPVVNYAAKMFRMQGGGVTLGKVPKVLPVEQEAAVQLGYWRNRYAEMLSTYDDDVLELAGKITNQKGLDSTKTRFSFVSAQDIKNPKYAEALQLSNKITKYTEDFKNYAINRGLDFKEENQYGLTQILKQSAIKPKNYEQVIDDLADAFYIQRVNKFGVPQNIKRAKTQAKKIAGEYLNTSTRIRNNSIWAKENQEALFQTNNNIGRARDEKFVLNAAKHFDKKRTLYDQEARARVSYLFEQNPIITLQQLTRNTIPVAEFVKRFGAKGEGITKLFKDIDDNFKSFADPQNKFKSVKELYRVRPGIKQAADKEKQKIKDSLEAYFGVYQADKAFTSKTGLAFATFLQSGLAMTRLLRVAIPSMGDWLQLITNSGYRASIKALMSKANLSDEVLSLNNVTKQVGGKDVSWTKTPWTKLRGRDRIENLLERELSDVLVINGGNGLQNYQRNVLKATSDFFEIFQLGRVTRIARNWAFNAGVERTLDISKLFAKGKSRTLFQSKTAIEREISQLGLNPKELKYLSQFKNTVEAIEDPLAKSYLKKAGINSADRDALIPTVGNRRLFAQSKSPLVKFLGSFLSWSQAKTSQTNALLARIENGDAALFLRMAAALPLYHSIRQIQVALSTNQTYKDSVVEESTYEKVGEALGFSGLNTFGIEKVRGIIQYSDYGSSLPEQIAPVLGYMEDIGEVIISPVIVMTDDEADTLLEGISKVGIEGLEVVPVAREFVPKAKELLDMEEEELLELRSQYTTGGLITGPEVPDTKENPADRVDPFTGMPYADQMARLGFDGGGEVDYESLGRQYTDDPLIAKIIGVESGGVVDKVSPAGAKGLMQIMPNTAEQPGFGVKPFQGNNLFNPIENVKFGTAYFYGLKKEFKNTRDTAIAYNWGHNNTKKWLEEGADLNKLPKETRNYIKKLNIDENLREQKQEGGGVNSLTPQVSDDYLESTQPFINPSFINENDDIPEGAIRIYEEDQGLGPVFPIVELLLGGPAYRGGKVVKEGAEQIISKKTMPKSVVHGSQYKGLKEIKSSSAQALEQVGKTNEGLQAGIYTSKPSGIATYYGRDGQVYTIDTSNISRGALFNFGKDKVLNTSNVPDSLIQTLNRKINDLTVTGPTREAASLNRFKKSLVSKEGVTFISPTTKDFLIDNNYKVIQTKLFKDPHFILLDDVVKVK